MGEKLAPEDMELYRRCDEILHYMWDPIGVAGSPGARDEYYSYLPHVFGLVRDDATHESIADYLVWVESDRMGTAARSDRDHDRIRDVVDALKRWRDVLKSDVGR